MTLPLSSSVRILTLPLSPPMRLLPLSPPRRLWRGLTTVHRSCPFTQTGFARYPTPRTPSLPLLFLGRISPVLAFCITRLMVLSSLLFTPTSCGSSLAAAAAARGPTARECAALRSPPRALMLGECARAGTLAALSAHALHSCAGNAARASSSTAIPPSPQRKTGLLSSRQILPASWGRGDRGLPWPETWARALIAAPDWQFAEFSRPPPLNGDRSGARPVPAGQTNTPTLFFRFIHAF